MPETALIPEAWCLGPDGRRCSRRSLPERLHVIAVHPRDVRDWYLLGAHGLALALVRAHPETLGIHLIHHPDHAAVAFGLSLREPAEVRDFRRREEVRRSVLARRDTRAAADAGGRVHGLLGDVLRNRDRVAVGRPAGIERDVAA